MLALPAIFRQQCRTREEVGERRGVGGCLLGARAGNEVEFCQMLASLLFSDQRGATVKLIDELEDRLFPLLWRSMCCEQPPDAEMRCGSSFLRDEGIGGFLDTVVDKPVGALEPLDHLVTDRFPQMRVDRLLRGLLHEGKG